MMATLSVGSWVGQVSRTDERSTRPSSPSARNGASHLAAVRSLTPAAAAARFQPSSITADREGKRPFGGGLGVSVDSHPVSSLTLKASTPSVHQEDLGEQRLLGIQLGRCERRE
jgi:hypothetical protein